MKKILVLVITLVLLGAGGAAGTAFLGVGPFAGWFKKEKAAEAPPPVETPKDQVFDVGTYVIPIVSRHIVSRQIGLDLEIRVAAASADKVEPLLPRLQNAFVIDLYDTVPRHSNSRSVADQQAIHDRLVKVGNTLFGEGAIRDVIIKSIYDR